MYESDDDLFDDVFEELRNEQWLMDQLKQASKEKEDEQRKQTTSY